MSAKDILSGKGAKVMLALVVAVLSATVVTALAVSPEMHAATLEYLDAKKAQAMGVTAASAVVSAAAAAIPGDASSPIAEQIAGMSGYMVIVVCAIFVEKMLVTLTGYLSFRILIPLVCILFVIYQFKKNEALKNLGIKLALFAVVIFAVVPVGVQVSAIIESTLNMDSAVESVVDAADEEAGEKNEDEGFLGKLEGFANAAKNKATDAKDAAFEALNSMIDAAAAMIVTMCVIPIAVLALMLWIVNMLFGTNFKAPSPKELRAKLPAPAKKEEAVEIQA